MAQEGEERPQSWIAEFLTAYLYNLVRNLIAAVLLIGLVAIFALVFYREAIPYLQAFVYFILRLLIDGKLWPVVLFVFLLSAWPRRVRRRRGKKPAAGRKKPVSSRPAGGREGGGQ